jgi:YD repeat-containing protein
MADPSGQATYTYDTAGNVTEISSSNQNGAIMAYQYDKLNRISTVTVPGQSPTLYSYRNRGQTGRSPSFSGRVRNERKTFRIF